MAVARKRQLERIKSGQVGFIEWFSLQSNAAVERRGQQENQPDPFFVSKSRWTSTPFLRRHCI
jgi:hypothetical protein